MNIPLARPGRARAWHCARAFVAAGLIGLASAAGPLIAADSAPDDEAKEKPQAPPAVPLSQLAAEADAATIALRKTTAGHTIRNELAAIEAVLPALAREVDVRSRENASILAQSPSIDLLRDLDSRWTALRGRLADAGERLEQLLATLEAHRKHIGTVEKTWTATAALAAEEKAPPELVRRIESLLAETRAARRQVDADRTAALRMQTRVSALDFRAAEAVQANRAMRDQSVARMLRRDGPPLWDPQFREKAGTRILAGAGEALRAQRVLLDSYLRLNASLAVLHATALILLAALFNWVRRRLIALVGKEPQLERATEVVRHPVASALVVALILAHWIYPHAPRLLAASIGVALLVPTIVVLRPLISPHLRVPLYTVLAFYLADQLRAVAASVDIVPRLLFVAEMIAAAALLITLRYRFRARARGSPPGRLAGLLRPAATLAGGICVATAAANAAGYIALSNLVGGAVLDSMYAGLVLYAAVQILDALLQIALRTRPLVALNMVRNRRAILQRRVRLAMHWAAMAIWTLHVLDRLAVRDRVLDTVRAALDAKMSIGQIDISLSAVLSFILAVWAAFLVSRLVRFVLDEEVFPHAPLRRGIPYAISRTIHFAIVALGFVIAMGIIGMEMTQFTILASAFTIGVGFGLQNIFNNFVSGLIVLFERPVQVGDVIQIDDAMGVVERIGIRASVVSTASGSHIIVPNGKLISERVVNWTLSGRRRVIELPLAVGLQSDPEHVIAILEGAARNLPGVLDDPPARAIVARLGADTMGLELRVATSRVEDWMTVRSALAVAVMAALREANITVR